jgi:FixJ family two-component response regulator
MCTYTIKELAAFYGTSKRTFERHYSKIKKKFKKTSLGAQLNEADAEALAGLMKFSIPPKSDKNRH